MRVGCGLVRCFNFGPGAGFGQPVLSSDLMSATDAPGRSCVRGEKKKKRR